MSVAQWCQAYFILAAGGILALGTLPNDIKRLFVGYGPRTLTNEQRSGTPSKSQSLTLGRLANGLTSWGRVPHSWFLSFYITSTACSVFWAIQYLANGRILHLIAAQQASRTTAFMPLNKTIAVWVLLAVHGTRRLLEHLLIMKASKSDMWFIHWLFGMSFYLCMSIAVWIEGSVALLGNRPGRQTASLRQTSLIGWVMLFMLASVAQHLCHKYLAGLRKYSLPNQGPFRYILCPHYTCECLIYLSLAFIAAPDGRPCNQTVLCGLLLVTVNLGVTASGTKRWYIETFGSGKVGTRWAMIPFIL